MECNLCGCSSFYGKATTGEIICRQCHSFPRTRLLAMFLEREPMDSSTRVLHLAPEEGLYNRLKTKISPGNYHVRDFNPDRYKFCPDIERIDLCNLSESELPTEHYDLVIHSHVLEHTPCSLAYTLFHIHRSLKPQGKQICVIPFMYGEWDESFKEIGDEERSRRFGQFDHVRRIGRADVARHPGKIVNIPAAYSALDHFSADELRQFNIPETEWNGLTISTVLILRKQDYLLQ